MRIILSLLLMTACGSASNMAEPTVSNEPAPTTGGADVDLQLLEGIQVWKEDCQRYSSYNCARLLESVDRIRVGRLEDGTLGQCNLWTLALIVTRREVVIRPEIAANPAALRAVLAHELGHCALLLNHVTSDASHLMAPYLSVDSTLEARLPAMLQRFYADAQANTLPRIE